MERGNEFSFENIILMNVLDFNREIKIFLRNLKFSK